MQQTNKSLENHIDNLKRKRVLSTQEKILLETLQSKLEPECKIIYQGKTEKIKSPQIVNETYKIETWLHQQQKQRMKIWETINGWKKEESIAIINNKETPIIVLKKHIEWPAENAFVQEYIDNWRMPPEYIGQQFFNGYAITNFWLRNNFSSYEEMKNMRWGDKNHQEFLKKNFQKDGENMLPGYRHNIYKTFTNVGGRISFWLADGSCMDVSNKDMHHNYYDHNYYLSVRMFKD